MLREEVIENLRDCDYIIHAGDIGDNNILEKLQSITKTFAVKGNNDRKGLVKDLPEYIEIEMDETLIYVVHNKEDIPSELREIDLVIYGHSHKYENENKDGIIYLNPGSCGKKRFALPLSMAKVEVNMGEVEIERIEL